MLHVYEENDDHGDDDDDMTLRAFYSWSRTIIVDGEEWCDVRERELIVVWSRNFQVNGISHIFRMDGHQFSSTEILGRFIG